MGKVVLSKEDIRKLDELINMFEEQKKKFEEFKKEHQDGIIDFESSTDIILYDAYIVLAKLIKKLPNVEGSDVFQEYVNVVLNDLIGNLMDQRCLCYSLQKRPEILISYVKKNHDDMLDFVSIVNSLFQIHSNSKEKVNISNDFNKIFSLLMVMFFGAKSNFLREYIAIIYKFMYIIVSHLPDTSKKSFNQLNDFYFNAKDRFNKLRMEIPDLLFVDNSNVLKDYYVNYENKLLLKIKEIRERIRIQVDDGTYNDKDKEIALSIVLICGQAEKCLKSYIGTRRAVYDVDYVSRNSEQSLDSILMIPDFYKKTGILVSDNYLMSFSFMFFNLSTFLGSINGFADEEYLMFSDVFSFLNAKFLKRYGGGILKNYVPLANDISRNVQHMSIDEKIDYYLEYMAKYREEMIKENGSSLVNVLNARKEQLEGNGVPSEEIQVRPPQGRNAR